MFEPLEVTFDDDLHQYLSNHDHIKAWVADRIFPGLAGQKESDPYVTYERLSSEPNYFFTQQGSLLINFYQFDILSESFKIARLIEEGFIVALSGFSGMMGKSEVRWVEFIDSFDGATLLETGASEDQLNRIVMEFSVTRVFNQPVITGG